jgi:4-amino-4-deoxy-L-arabinose transferase-like glycosyltransferase
MTAAAVARTGDRPAVTRTLPAFAVAPVGGVAAALVVLLLATAGRYGYHRDELYFRLLARHLAVGYVDQPPWVALVARGGIAVFGDTVFALRVVPALTAAATAVVLALIAREAGGRAAAQTLAALGAMGLFPLIAGHTLLTVGPDLLVWTLVTLALVRALLRRRRSAWLAAGCVAGLGTYNKHLVVLLLVGVAGGLLLAGPRAVLRSPWPWAAAGIAMLIAAANLAYQAVHGFPQVAMARALAAHKGPQARELFLPLQPVLLGLPLAAVWPAGWWSLLRRPDLRRARAIAVAYPLMCVLLLITAGQFYYTLGLVLSLHAIGSVTVLRWAGQRRRRHALVWAAVVLNTAIAAVVALPLLPVRTVAGTPIPAINQVVRDQLGWPTYVAQIAAVYRRMPDRGAAVLIVGNYGEAGAVERYGARYRLPRVYSGQNQLYYLGRPPESATSAVVVMQGDSAGPLLRDVFRRCTVVARLDNGLHVANEEQDTPIRVCAGRRGSWAALWPRFRALD